MNRRGFFSKLLVGSASAVLGVKTAKAEPKPPPANTADELAKRLAELESRMDSAVTATQPDETGYVTCNVPGVQPGGGIIFEVPTKPILPRPDQYGPCTISASSDYAVTIHAPRLRIGP